MEEKSSYKNILVEVRPRLQSLNIIINLNQPLPLSNFKIGYEDGNILVCNDTCEDLTIPFDKPDLVPDKVGNIQTTDNYVTFKYFTKNKRGFGTFNIEILKHKVGDTPKNITTTFIKPNTNYELECANCTQKISKEITFNRVLPLPSDFLDAGNWFCHGHSQNMSLEPKINDVFYTECYIHLNSKLCDNIIQAKPNIICKRCFAWLGTIITDKTFRFWTNTVSFSNGDEKNITNPLEDCFCIISSISRNSLINTAKVILTCQIAKNRSDFILLWILEKQLNIVLRDGNDDYKDLNVAKVLFKFVSDGNELLDKWTNDMTTPTVHISKPMMSRLMEELSRMNKLLPRDFASSIGFFVSYLHLYDL